MQDLKGDCPKWIKKSLIEKQWQGIRAKPTNQPAPLLETLEMVLY